MSALLRLCMRPVFAVLLWSGRALFKWHRLDRILLVELGAPIGEVFALYDYGYPVTSLPDENLPGATVHTLTAGLFHTAVVVQWNGRVCCVAYWSEYPDRQRDLKCMLDKYGQGLGWKELEPGYVCVRNDNRVWLRCSAAPAISVETAEYLAAKGAASERT